MVIQFAGLVAFAAAFGAMLPLLEREIDVRNVRALSRHLDCSISTARSLYHLARRDGYGAAHQRVFADHTS